MRFVLDLVGNYEERLTPKVNHDAAHLILTYLKVPPQHQATLLELTKCKTQLKLNLKQLHKEGSGLS